MLNNIIEEWRPVVEFPDRYEVSNLGRARFVNQLLLEHGITDRPLNNV